MGWGPDLFGRRDGQDEREGEGEVRCHLEVQRCLPPHSTRVTVGYVEGCNQNQGGVEAPLALRASRFHPDPTPLQVKG